MRGKGITYDTGFLNAGASTRPSFDPDLVKRELRIIHDDLHCTAVRVTGGDLDRLELAAVHGAEAGLEVWMSPFTCDLTRSELLDLLSDCAERAERLRRGGADLVLLTGSELALTTIGFLPGESIGDRFALLSQPHRLREVLPAVPGPVNDFLGQAVEVVRARFGGMVSYASMPFERVDWTPFDVVSSDAGYRSVEIADRYRDGLRALTALGKPVAITEFGCTTYRGAADKGAHGDMVVEWGADGRPVGLKGELVRDEDEQAACLRELLDILEEEAVESAFVNTFARYDLPHIPGSRDDFDMASYGVVKVLEEGTGDTYAGMPWEPKAAFRALADRYGA